MSTLPTNACDYFDEDCPIQLERMRDRLAAIQSEQAGTVEAFLAAHLACDEFPISKLRSVAAGETEALPPFDEERFFDAHYDEINSLFEDDRYYPDNIVNVSSLGWSIKTCFAWNAIFVRSEEMLEALDRPQ